MHYGNALASYLDHSQLSACNIEKLGVTRVKARNVIACLIMHYYYVECIVEVCLLSRVLFTHWCMFSVVNNIQPKAVMNS